MLDEQYKEKVETISLGIDPLQQHKITMAVLDSIGNRE